jgi:hypothetical protein
MLEEDCSVVRENRQWFMVCLLDQRRQAHTPSFYFVSLYWLGRLLALGPTPHVILLHIVTFGVSFCSLARNSVFLYFTCFPIRTF